MTIAEHVGVEDFKGVEHKCNYTRCDKKVVVSSEFEERVRAANKLAWRERVNVLERLYGEHDGFFCDTAGKVYCGKRCYDMLYED